MPTRKFRYNHDKGRVVEVTDNSRLPGRCEIVSDALGFGECQLKDFEKDRRSNGFRGIEFVPDRAVPGFFQVKCKSLKEHERYVRHRGLVCDNKTQGGGISAGELQAAIDREQAKAKPPQ